MKHSALSILAFALLSAPVALMANPSSTDLAREAVPLSEIAEAAYSVSAEDVSTKAGEATKVMLSIKAKSGYKVNAKYPTKVTASAPGGVELQQSKFRTKDGTFKDKKTLEFAVPVMAKIAGKHKVDFKVKFSVCSADQCLLKKATVQAMVSAK